MPQDSAGLRAFALNCSLRSSGSDTPSSTDKMIDGLMDALRPHGVIGTTERVVDHDVKPGVFSDMGDGDAWPGLREQITAADIFILGRPIWLGQPSSIARRVLERMDAFLGEADEDSIEEAATALRVHGVSVQAITADLSRQDSIAALWDAMQDRPVDYLMANAG